MSIPELTSNGELPPGEYEVTIDEVEERFGSSNPKRKALMKGLRAAARNLKEAGIQRIWINGSFVTSKPEPKDVDGCWEYSREMNLVVLDPVFINRSRLPMKAKYGIEFFISAIMEVDSGLPFPRFFQLNRDGEPKGIVVVNLGGAE